MKALLHKALKNSLTIVFPPICLDCHEEVVLGEVLCPACQELIEVLNPAEYCPRCFSSMYDKDQKRCNLCHRSKMPFISIAAACEHIGPAKILIQKFKERNEIYLCEGIAAYMTAQFIRIGWPQPDLIVPVPTTITKRFIRGYNPAEILAEKLSNNLNVPYKNILKRSQNDLSQTGLSTKQRENNLAPFKMKKNIDRNIKNILLVDDFFKTGATLRNSSKAIIEKHPCYIYGLTFCRDT